MWEIDHPFTPISHYTMTLEKGQSASHRKGKEIVSDALAVRDVGEEAVITRGNHISRVCFKGFVTK